MALVVPNDGELALLDYLRTYLNTLSLRLYKNDFTPIPGTLIGDFTEATFPSYLSVVPGDFGAAATTTDGKGQTQAGVRTFTRGAGAGSETIYGYYMVGAGPRLVYAERNPAGGVVIDTAGQTYSVLPRFTLFSEF